MWSVICLETTDKTILSSKCGIIKYSNMNVYMDLFLLIAKTITYLRRHLSHIKHPELEM